MADEWTFVSRDKGSKHRPRRRGENSQRRQTGGGGLYGASAAGGPGHHADASGQALSDAEQRKQRERVKCDVLECLGALEDQLNSGRGFAFRVISSMARASSANDHDEGEDASKSADGADEAIATINRLRLRDIVAYGIGNFSTGRFHAPMLQLACLLLIRRCAAELGGKGDQDDGTKIERYEREQRQVPIYYYEPDMLPVEKELLETVFHVHVLDSNELGKLAVESMRRHHPTLQKESGRSLASECPGHTLFYMPHCPMRLYCNVLWAHWDHMFPTVDDKTEKHNGNPILIFGNSFRGYDEGVISSEKRSDPTNGVLRIVPFVREMPTCDDGRRRSRDEIVVDSLRHLEMAFNDCNVISFSMQSQDDKERRWPDRPMEWDSSQGSEENGERCGDPQTLPINRAIVRD